MTGSGQRDPDWGSGDPSRLDDVRRGLEQLSGDDDVRRLEDAVAAALRATPRTPFDRDKLWERLERSLTEASKLQQGEAGRPGEADQSGKDSTPGR